MYPSKYMRSNSTLRSARNARGRLAWDDRSSIRGPAPNLTTLDFMPLHTAHQGDGEQIVWAARMEIIVVLWRIREALKALASRADETTVARWNHGIARELVRDLGRFYTIYSLQS